MSYRIKRRAFILLLGGAAIAWPLAARAQQGERMRRIGVLMNIAAGDAQAQPRMDAFLHGLQPLGWTSGVTSESTSAGRRPMQVCFVNTILEELRRRER